MAIELRCDCGNVFSLEPKMAGKKVRCGGCGKVLQAPAGKSPKKREESEDLVAAPAPMELPSSLLSMDADGAVPKEIAAMAESDEAPGGADSDYEVVGGEAAQPVSCSVCGTTCNPSDAVCLACGSDLNSGGEGLVNKLLKKFPKKARIGVAAGAGGIVIIGLIWFLYASGADASFARKGRAAMELEDWSGALELFKKAREWNPRNQEALAGATECAIALKKKDFTKYAGDLTRELGKAEKEKVSIDRPTMGAVYMKLARYALEALKNDSDTALKFLDGAEKFGGKDLEGLRELRGHTFFKRNEWDSAKPMYKEALERGSKDALVPLNLARIERRAGNAEEAEKLLAQAMAVSPGEANVELGRIKEAQGKWSEAEEHWSAAVAANPSLHSARLGYARILLRKNETGKALEQAEQAKQLEGEDLETRVVLLDALYRQRRFEDAQAECTWIIKKDSKNITAQFFEGAIQLGKGLDTSDKKLIESGTKAILATVSLEKDANRFLAAARILLKVEGRERDAEKLAQDAIRLNPQLIEAHEVLIEAVRKTSRGTQQLEKVLKDALAVDPKNRIFNRTLAQLYWANEQETEALELLRKVVGSGCKDEDILFELARKLIERASIERDRRLPDAERKPLLEEALKLLEEDLKKRLASQNTELPDLINLVKTQLLQIN